MARTLDFGVTAWSPLGGGVLSGKYNKQNSNELKRFKLNNPISASLVNDRNTSIAAEVQTIANEMNKHDRGARTEAQIKDNSACLDFELTTDQLRRLDEKSKIQLGIPHDFISEAATNS